MQADASPIEQRLAEAGAEWRRARDQLRTEAAERDDLVIEAVAAGLSLRQIAGLLGVTHGAVQQIVERARARAPEFWAIVEPEHWTEALEQRAVASGRIACFPESRTLRWPALNMDAAVRTLHDELGINPMHLEAGFPQPV